MMTSFAGLIGVVMLAILIFLFGYLAGRASR